METLFHFLCCELYTDTVRELIANASKGLLKIISLLSTEEEAISGLALIVLLQICTLSCGRNALITAANICTLLHPLMVPEKCNVQYVRRGYERAVLVAAALCRQTDLRAYGESDIATFCMIKNTKTGSGGMIDSSNSNKSDDDSDKERGKDHGNKREKEMMREKERERERENIKEAKIRRMVYFEILHTITSSSTSDNNNNNDCVVPILSLSDLIVLPLDKKTALKLSGVAGNVGAKAIADIVCHSDEQVLGFMVCY